MVIISLSGIGAPALVLLIVSRLLTLSRLDKMYVFTPWRASALACPLQSSMAPLPCRLLGETYRLSKKREF